MGAMWPVIAERRDDVVTEAVVQLGPDGHLVGVLTRGVAAAPKGATTRPVVIFLNAGVIHRVGPHRLHVVLARRVAERGITSLRLDLSGIGDSRSVPGALSFRESAVADARTAMDWVTSETGARRFVLVGLCSGANNALATAVADERVVGIVALDPPAYGTRAAHVRNVVARLRSLGGPRAAAAWGASAALRRMRRHLGALRRPTAAPVERSEASGAPPLAEYREQLGALVDRGVAILAVFSGGLGARYNHEDQLFELLPELRGRVDRAWFADANHTFTELAAQAELVSTVARWLERFR